MSKLFLMFMPSRRRVELGGNGGCGGMVSVILIALVILTLKLTGVA